RPEFYGYVKHNDYDYYSTNFDFSIHIGSIYDYHDHFFYGNHFRNNYRKYREDSNFYYYKSRSKKGKDKIIKRRKQGKRASVKKGNTKRKSSYKKYDSNKSTKRNTIKRKSSYKKYDSNKSIKRNTLKRKPAKRNIKKRKVETSRSKRQS
ncbi:MAG: hypothetical protein JKZ00_04430, partial [Flavobacteriaceae bacterium]|nr:hypothetical protein [Flavobacteriaceae bacterium]